MLDWLKTILGEAYTEEIDKQVSQEIGKAFVAKADFNAKNEKAKELETQLKAAGETIEGFKSLDVEGIKKAAEEYKQKAEQAEKDAAAKIQELQRDHLYEGIVSAPDLKFTSESAKDSYVRALKEKALPIEDGKLLGYNDFLEGYKKKDPGAFASGNPAPKVVLPTGDQKPGEIDDARVRAVMGLPPKKD